MIQTKEDLKYYISRDRARYKVSTARLILEWFIHGETYQAIRYLKALRHCEYYTNNKEKGFFYKLMANFYRLKMKRLGNIYRIKIDLNLCGPGVWLVHLNGGIRMAGKSIGENLTISTGCLIGRNGKKLPTVGNNVELCVGAKIIGEINVGNNVIVAPNSVVVKDVPDNCIVSGIPAVIIKRIEPKENSQTSK